MRRMMNVSEAEDCTSLFSENIQLKNEVFELQDMVVALETEVRIISMSE